MDQELIKSKFPSICYQCKNSRRVASDTNTEKGYVGCAEFARKMKVDDNSIDFIKEGDFIGEGWVDLRSAVFSKPSGITTNFQLITQGIRNCTEFSQDE